MADATVTFKVNDKEFQRTLKEYARVCKSRTIPEIVNTKAFFIARRAVVETEKADAGKIRAFFNKGTQAIVGKIINFRRGQRGEKGLYGDEMKEAQAMMKAARLRSVAFIKSGWLPAIKTLSKLVPSKRGAARSEEGDRTGRAKIVGQEKGKAKPATGGWLAKAIITNMADARHDTRNALLVKGGAGLQKAIDYEEKKTREYIEEKLRRAAKDTGIKTN